MGIWGALTIQGKLAVAAALLIGLTLVGYLYGDEGQKTDALDSPGFVTPNTQLQAASSAAISPTRPPGATAQASPSPSGSPASSPSGAATPTSAAGTATPGASPTATEAAPTPTEVVVLPTLPPTPEPPTATPAPACVVNASVSPSTPSGSDRVSGQLVCTANSASGAQMNAVFLYQKLSSGCSAVGDGSGSASCGVSVASAEPGSLISVEVCFSSNGRYCATVTP